MEEETYSMGPEITSAEEKWFEAGKQGLFADGEQELEEGASAGTENPEEDDDIEVTVEEPKEKAAA